MNYQPIEYPINLCPVCGLPAETTGRICPKHYQITYDQDGNVVSHKDIAITIPMCKWYTTTGYPTFKPKMPKRIIRKVEMSRQVQYL
jgi:hypothetical protein